MNGEQIDLYADHRRHPWQAWPQSCGFVERLHRTLLDEHFRVMGRKKFYKAVAEMQTDLGVFPASYNSKRPREGRGMKGRTPAKAVRHQII